MVEAILTVLHDLQGAFIQTIEALSTLGYIVMVSNQGRYFRVASYLASFTQKSIVIAMGIPALKVQTIFLANQCSCQFMSRRALDGLVELLASERYLA